MKIDESNLGAILDLHGASVREVYFEAPWLVIEFGFRGTDDGALTLRFPVASADVALGETERSTT